MIMVRLAKKTFICYYKNLSKPITWVLWIYGNKTNSYFIKQRTIEEMFSHNGNQAKIPIVYTNYFVNETFLKRLCIRYKTSTLKSYLIKCKHDLTIKEAKSF